MPSFPVAGEIHGKNMECVSQLAPSIVVVVAVEPALAGPTVRKRSYRSVRGNIAPCRNTLPAG